MFDLFNWSLEFQPHSGWNNKIVIITIAVSIEGLVYIFKAGRGDLTLLLYPALLIVVSAILIVALGVYQKLSATIEKVEKENA